jgi:hypothetical protein
MTWEVFRTRGSCGEALEVLEESKTEQGTTKPSLLPNPLVLFLSIKHLQCENQIKSSNSTQEFYQIPKPRSFL